MEQLIDDDITVDEYEYKENKSKKNSLRRTLNTIYDISRCNNWSLFVTLTFNPKKVDSFNYDECSLKVKSWLDFIRRKNPNIKYIGVPEKHKSGRYHFHFLFDKAENLKLVDSGYFTKSGLTIYNIDNYNWGYSTATKVTNTDAVNKYIAKYITKDLFGSTKGKKRYWASRNCNKPDVKEEYHYNIKDVINNLDNSSTLLHKQSKKVKYINPLGEEVTTEIIYYELDS